MIVNEYITIKGHPRNIKYYKDIGYDIKVRQEIEINIKDASPGLTLIIDCCCDICGSPRSMQYREYYSYTNGLSENYYCNVCNKQKLKETCLQKYGVDNPMKSDIVQKSLKKSLLDKYGVDHYSKTDDYKTKYKKTCMEKYGVDNVFQVDEFKEKIKKTNKKRHGVDYPMQSIDILEKSNNTNIDRYGYKRPLQSKQIFSSLKEKNREKYGVEFVSQLPDFTRKTINTNREKYGVDYYQQSEDYKKMIKDGRELNTFDRYSEKMDEYDINSYLDGNFTIYHKECNPIGGYSSQEMEIFNWIQSLGIKVERSNREILGGKEIDIYLPDHNIGIEFNGLFWHSDDIIHDHFYHYNKTITGNDKGVDIIHIWEDEWKYKKDIVKSFLSNKIGIIDNRIYARKCIIKDVSSKDCRQFLDANHLQGFAKSKYKIGLYYNNELVSLMTFGNRVINSKKEMELIRFCNKIDYLIIGAASKLFKYFIKNFEHGDIVSYSDSSHFKGALYKSLGFEYAHHTGPNYWWVVKGKRHHRFKYNKKRLVSEGFDPNKTEEQIMKDLGNYRIWGCGQKKWIYSI